jgi:hypothetical protein
MARRDLIFEKKVSLGNVIEIGMILATLVWATAFVKADVDNVKKEHLELKVEFKAHEVLSREQIRLNEQTYVRKDVFDQVMRQLEQIQSSIQRLDAKVSK